MIGYMDLMLENYFRLAEYMQSGGVVMLPLALVSVAMWLLIIDRVLFFRRLQYKPMRAQIALDHIKADRMPDPKQYRLARFLLHRLQIQVFRCLCLIPQYLYLLVFHKCHKG